MAEPGDGVVTISSAQLGYLLSGIDWRHPQEMWRPTSLWAVNHGSSPAPNVAPIAPAIMATLIMTAKLNDVDPQAWLADVRARINDHAIHRLDELFPWNWATAMERRKVAA
jgi:IS66 C-terminal element